MYTPEIPPTHVTPTHTYTPTVLTTMTDPVAPSPPIATNSTSTPTSTPTPTPLEALQQRHRKEQRDLVSRITQKKKQASKKTRKGVNDECERLERELRERQEGEMREVEGERGDGMVDEEAEEELDGETGGDAKDEVVDVDVDADIDVNMGRLDINTAAASTPSSPPPSTTPSTAPPTATPARKKNRAKERLARRKAEQDAAIAQAEEEARNAPNPRELEKQRFEPLLTARKLVLHEIRADGHCLYAAVADQLCTRDLSLSPRILGSNVALADEAATSPPPYKMVRYVAAGWIESHREDFEAFMEDSLQEHVRKIRETGEWGGHLELLALARGYGVRICVLHSDGRVDRIGDEDMGEAGKEEKEKDEVWLGYYRHSHGLGEHYNSLRKVE